MYYQYELTHFKRDMGHGVASDVSQIFCCSPMLWYSHCPWVTSKRHVTRSLPQFAVLQRSPVLLEYELWITLISLHIIPSINLLYPIESCDTRVWTLDYSDLLTHHPFHKPLPSDRVSWPRHSLEPVILVVLHAFIWLLKYTTMLICNCEFTYFT